MKPHTVRYMTPELKAMQYTYPITPEMIEFLGEQRWRESKTKEYKQLELDIYCISFPYFMGQRLHQQHVDETDYVIKFDNFYFIISEQEYTKNFTKLNEVAE